MKIGDRVQELYGLICLLGPSGPHVVSRPKTPNGQDFSRYHNFNESNF